MKMAPSMTGGLPIARFTRRQVWLIALCLTCPISPGQSTELLHNMIPNHLPIERNGGKGLSRRLVMFILVCCTVTANLVRSAAPQLQDESPQLRHLMEELRAGNQNAITNFWAKMN